MELEPKLTQQMDGFRMRKLRQCFDKALEKSLKNINKEVFLQCFDLAVIERNSELFSKLHQEFLQTLSVQLKNEFENICKRRKMVDQLNKLDSIQINVSCSPETENTLLKELFGEELQTIPDARISSLQTLVQMKQKEKERLLGLRTSLEQEKKNLEAIIEKSKAEQEETKKRVETYITNLDQALKELNIWDTSSAKLWIEQVQNLINASGN